MSLFQNESHKVVDNVLRRSSFVPFRVYDLSLALLKHSPTTAADIRSLWCNEDVKIALIEVKFRLKMQGRARMQLGAVQHLLVGAQRQSGISVNDHVTGSSRGLVLFVSCLHFLFHQTIPFLSQHT